MPTYEQAPGQRNLVFIHPKDGKFHVKSENKEYSTIEGTLEMIKVEADAGNPQKKILPYEALIIHIGDNDNLYRIKIDVTRWFSLSLAPVLNGLKKGDMVRLTVREGSKDSKVTFCNAAVQAADGSWIRPENDPNVPDSKEDKVEYIKKVLANHSARSTKVDVEDLDD